MRYYIMIGLLVCNFCNSSSVFAQAEVILDSYHAYLLRTDTLSLRKATSWEKTLLMTGRWSDIDYENDDLAGWKIRDHLIRVREMIKVWSFPESYRFHSPSLLERIYLALDHWLVHSYQSSNWWHNEIGVPQLMRDIIILLGDQLQGDRLEKALSVMAQLRVNEDYVGGNLIWCADLGLHYGALTDDQSLMQHCRNLIIREIKITTGEGIQPDYSFHQHGRRLQMYQYGKAYLWESVRAAWQCKDTYLAFPESKIDVLLDFILQGWQWMARGINTVPGTMDRSSSRVGELKSPDLRLLIPLAIELSSKHANELQKMLNIQNDEGSLSGFRSYPYSDFVAYHRPEFSFFIKAISLRTLPTEHINGENRLGKLLNSGDAYLIRNGEEYFDLMPAWNWTALPGITAFKNADHIDRKSFVGGVDNGEIGLFVMDYVLNDKSDSKSIATRKLWACYKDQVIGLISNINSDGIEDTVYTALDQCRWQDEVTVNKLGNVLTEGRSRIDSVNWIHHADFAYIPLKSTRMEIRIGQKKALWTTINSSEIRDTVFEKVFLPLMIHDPRSERGEGYILSLAESPEIASEIFARPNWNILQNDENCQAIKFNDGTLMIAFYEAGSLPLEIQGELKVDRSCLLLVKGHDVYASDPTHEGGSLQLAIDNKKWEIQLPASGSTAHKNIN